MPRKDTILSLPGFAIQKVSGYNPLVIDIHYRNGKIVRRKSCFIHGCQAPPAARH